MRGTEVPFFFFFFLLSFLLFSVSLMQDCFETVSNFSLTFLPFFHYYEYLFIGLLYSLICVSNQTLFLYVQYNTHNKY